MTPFHKELLQKRCAEIRHQIGMSSVNDVPAAVDALWKLTELLSDVIFNLEVEPDIDDNKETK